MRVVFIKPMIDPPYNFYIQLDPPWGANGSTDVVINHHFHIKQDSSINLEGYSS